MNDRTQTSATTAFAAACGALLVLGLTACTGIDDLLHNQHSETFATYDAAEEGWVGVGIPSWIPDDATDLRSIASTNEQVAVIGVTTNSPLAGDCTEQERHGVPAFDADWVPDTWPDTVSVCGEYEVMAVEDGWVGWFNAAEEGDVPG